MIVTNGPVCINNVPTRFLEIITSQLIVWENLGMWTNIHILMYQKKKVGGQVIMVIYIACRLEQI